MAITPDPVTEARQVLAAAGAAVREGWDDTFREFVAHLVGQHIRAVRFEVPMVGGPTRQVQFEVLEQLD